MKKPASAKHLTFAVAGRRLRNLSQCRMEANPPAEQPERSAYEHEHFRRKLKAVSSHNKLFTFSALSIPFVNSSSMIACQTLSPLK